MLDKSTKCKPVLGKFTRKNTELVERAPKDTQLGMPRRRQCGLNSFFKSHGINFKELMRTQETDEQQKGDDGLRGVAPSRSSWYKNKQDKVEES